MTETQTARKLAFRVLMGCESAGQYSALALDSALSRTRLDPKDRALATRLCYGTVEKQVTLDYVLSGLSKRPLESLGTDVKLLCRMGLYQLLYLDRVPDHAAVSETVEAAPSAAHGFVNAVLREFLRRGKQYPLPDREQDPAAYLSVTGAVPRALTEKFLSTFGPERTESLFAAYAKEPPLTLCTNRLKTTPQALAALVGGTVSPLVPTAVTVEKHTGSVTEMPGFAEGLFFVEDAASQVATAALDAHPGDLVADVCSAPGSKAFGAAVAMQNTGKLYAFDLHKNKLSLIRTGASRLGITVAEVTARDARTPDPALVGRCDRVICDVPCSGYGVLAKKPEIRFKNPADAAGLPAVQSAILEASSALVRPGGVLVYSTCTVFPEENEEVVGGFLTHHPEFHAEAFCVGGIASESGLLTLYPDLHGTDGFFVAKLVRQ